MLQGRDTKNEAKVGSQAKGMTGLLTFAEMNSERGTYLQTSVGQILFPGAQVFQLYIFLLTSAASDATTAAATTAAPSSTTSAAQSTTRLSKFSSSK